MKTNKKTGLSWMPLDNAAKIYPAARRRNWSNVFRLSVTLKEPVDVAVLEKALEVTVARFPSMNMSLHRGMFWFYLQQTRQPPQIRQESSWPLTRMSRREMRRCALRVIVYKNRIATEFFHALTDGNGGMVFLKTLTAEYLQQKCGVQIPCEDGILDRREEPKPEELEDSFPKYAGPVCASRKENASWQLTGKPQPGGFLHVTCFRLPVAEVLERAHQYQVSLTVFLAAVLMDALQRLQKEKVPNIRRRKPVKLQIPVNLRNLFPSKTLRNFAMYTTPEILPRLGEYDFPELCKVIRHWMGSDVTPKQMGMKIATNVSNERLMAVRVLPLFVKTLVMKAVFNAVGEKTSCLSMSNLGAVRLPEAMVPYVERLDFILGVKATSPYNCGVLSWQDTLYVNFIRNIRQPELERYFYQVLQEMDLPVTVESNGGL